MNKVALRILRSALSVVALTNGLTSVSFGQGPLPAPATGHVAAPGNGTGLAQPNEAIAPPLTSYIISPSDQLTVVVLGHDELRSEVTVLPDGSFTVPVAGTVRAAGLTLAQLTRALTDAYSVEMNQPQVTVMIRQTSQQVSVLGTVKTPGQFVFKPNMHILDALAAAGGSVQEMAQTKLTLLSASAHSSTTISGDQLLGQGALSANASLQPGDVLLVEQADPATTQVQVTGEVNHPGFYPVPATGATLESVINEAGGITGNAAQAHIQVQHGRATQELSLSGNGYASPPSADALVYAGDTVRVPLNVRKIAVVGEVHSPGAYPIPDGGTMTITSALVLAGGTTTEADKMRADILRRQPDGKGKAIPVNVASILKGDPSAPDLVLQPGDILYLPTHSPRGADAGSLISLLPGFSALLR